MILLCFAAACTAFCLIHGLHWHKRLTIPDGWVFDGDRFNKVRKKVIDRKPFNCVMCLSGWLSLGIGLVSSQGWYCLIMFPIGVIMGLVLDNGIRRYL